MIFGGFLSWPSEWGGPVSGKTRYNLEITNTTANPDGNGARLAILINGQDPGPTIITGI